MIRIAVVFAVIAALLSGGSANAQLPAPTPATTVTPQTTDFVPILRGPNFPPAYSTMSAVASVTNVCSALQQCLFPIGGNADDTASVQAAVNAAVANGTNWVYVSGHFCINTGPINISTAGVSIVGANRQITPFFDTGCGGVNHDVSVFNITGFHDELTGLSIQGSNSLTTTHDAVILGAGAVEAEVKDSIITGGRHALASAATDALINDIKAYNAYGSSILYFTANAYLHKAKLDQPYPVSTPAAGSGLFTIASWAGNPTSDTLGSLIQTGGWVLQTKTAGTEGTSAPTVLTYGHDIAAIGGTAVWQLVGAVTYYSVQLDTGVSVFNMSDADLTGGFSAGLGVTNTASGAAPQQIFASLINIGSPLQYGVYYSTGAGLRLSNSTISNCVASGANGIYLGGTDGAVSDSIVFGCDQGVGVVAAGQVITGTLIAGATNGVLVSANINNVIASANQFGSSTWGASTTGVNVASGSGSKINVTNNDCLSVSTCVTFNTNTGTNNTNTGNN